MFVPGIELNRGFYFDVVRAILADAFPKLLHSAALIGYGSDVLGYDDPTSMDHNWGPRMQIFLSDQDFACFGTELIDHLSAKLPLTYRGFPTNYTDPRYDHTQAMEPTDSYPVRHLIEVITVAEFFGRQLATGNAAKPRLIEWLGFTDQKLIEVTRGEVFYDGLSALEPIREGLSFYPRDIKLLRMAALWEGVSQQEAFVGRNRELGDLMNVKLISARIAVLLMKICFYIEEQYIPYSKWFGRGFDELACAGRIRRKVSRVLAGRRAITIENRLSDLYEKVIELHNQRGDLPKLGNKIKYYFGRPYKVIFAESIVSALLEDIADEQIQTIGLARYALDIKVDATDLTSCINTDPS